MKGRIIGREGRNIRALEIATGVDLIVDDTPGGGHPLRLRSVPPRDRARLARAPDRRRPHPSGAHRGGRREGQGGVRAAHPAGGRGRPARAQDPRHAPRARQAPRPAALPHSLRAERAAALARRSPSSPRRWPPSSGSTSPIAKRAGLLHDIGKAIDREIEGTHLELGIELLRKYGETRGGRPRDGVPPRRLRAADGRGGAGHRRRRALGGAPRRAARDPRDLRQAAREARGDRQRLQGRAEELRHPGRARGAHHRRQRQDRRRAGALALEGHRQQDRGGAHLSRADPGHRHPRDARRRVSRE